MKLKIQHSLYRVSAEQFNNFILINKYCRRQNLVLTYHLRIQKEN